MTDAAPGFTPQTWLEGYAAAWSGLDLRAAAELFAEDVAYSFDPFGEPLRGRRAGLAYWREALAGQRSVDLHVHVWAATASASAGEWWAVIVPSDGEPFTLSAS